MKDTDLPDVDVDSPHADPGKRLLARLIETAFQIVPGLVFVSIGVAVESRLLIRIGVIGAYASVLVVVAISLVWLQRYGQSVGKRLVGLRIVRSDGRRAGLTRLFLIRELLPGLLFILPLIGAGFYITDRLFIFGERRRCVHDYLADTIVVDVKKTPPTSF